MQYSLNKPIFVVGSPRSGTSILTWCLGHHPNLFPVPESNWMGDFAVNVALAYQTGAARGDHSILSAMDVRDEEFFAMFGQSINDLILRHRKDLERKRETRSAALKLDAKWLEATSMAVGPKRRWIDGTPEYSFYICALRKLFPGALFIHIVRDVHTVVRSMLNFHRVAGFRLVSSEQEAYSYWFRAVSACIHAERAYGRSVVYRIRYENLINNPESAMRSLLAFLEEAYNPRCLEPLKDRINSSSVPLDFKADPATDLALMENASRLCVELGQNAQPTEASPAAADELEAAFRERVRYVANLDNAYQEARRISGKLSASALASHQATELALSTGND
jgi:hypothetical protein